jgi:uncharacterized protein (TIGR03083 family)
MLPTDIRTAFTQAAEYFASLVANVPPDAWTKPALGVWTVRDLTGHGSRSLLTVETYLAQTDPSLRPTPSGLGDYFVTVLKNMPNGGAVAGRGVEAGQALGSDPAGAVAEIVQRVLPKVSAAPDDAPMETPFGTYRLIDYLPTRVFELAIHSLDLARAVGVESDPPKIALQLTGETAIAVAIERGSCPDLLLAMTGRQSLPQGFSVVI